MVRMLSGGRRRRCGGEGILGGRYIVVTLSLKWQSPYRRRTEELYCGGRPGFTITALASAGGLGYVI